MPQKRKRPIDATPIAPPPPPAPAPAPACDHGGGFEYWCSSCRPTDRALRGELSRLKRWADLHEAAPEEARDVCAERFRDAQELKPFTDAWKAKVEEVVVYATAQVNGLGNLNQKTKDFFATRIRVVAYGEEDKR